MTGWLVFVAALAVFMSSEDEILFPRFRPA
jgi:hypothetical protein